MSSSKLSLFPWLLARARKGDCVSGWIKLHRRVIASDIYQMPPLYLRVFERLIIEANHDDAEIPYNAGKKLIKRGERLTSVRQICDWVAWYERGILKTPNPKTIQTILDWLETNRMIVIYGDKGNRKETHYNIVNYSTYQGEDNNKVTVIGEVRKQSLDTNKNDKECKEDIYISTNVDICQNAHQDIVDFYNSECKSLPPVKVLTPKRKQTITARVREHGQEAVFEMLKKAGRSCFLAGQNKDGWVASFDWIFRPNNFVKVLEGNYDDKLSKASGGNDDNVIDYYEAAKKSKYGW